MKEVSIEDKAKRYDVAISIMEKYLKSGNAGVIAENTILKAFPELQESEDERIRKGLIKALSSIGKRNWGGIDVFESISWLEKQGEQHSAIRWYDVSLIPQEMEELLVEWDSEDATWHEIAFYHADTKTFWNGTRQVENVTRWCYIIDLLEKQGEQKPAEKIQFGKKYKCIASPIYSTFRIGEIYKPENEFLCSLMNFCSDCFKPIEDGEQKVEPKFKVGDWIVNNDSGVIQHIKEIVNVNDETLYVFDEDSVLDINFQEQYHLWTIQDAKDGDVLATGNEIVIFKKSTFNEKDLSGCIFVHCSLRDKKGSWYTIGGINPTNYAPATKEQCDTLMKAMTDAGYTFDFEKKELKKIEQKTVSITDEWIEDYWQHEKVNNPYSYDKGDKIQFDHQGFIRFCEKYCKKPAEWSKEDERLFQIIIDILDRQNHLGNISRTDLIACVRKLKSFRPQKQWRPTEKQLKWFGDILGYHNFSSEGQKIMEEIYEQLKQL